MMTSVADYFEGLKNRHAQEAADGKHDAECEYGPRLMPNALGEYREAFLHMCHCRKRRRIAAGFTEPPGPLEYRCPDCPRCGQETSSDGDIFECCTCNVHWGVQDPYGNGTFDDDYGNLGRPVQP